MEPITPPGLARSGRHPPGVGCRLLFWCWGAVIALACAPPRSPIGVDVSHFCSSKRACMSSQNVCCCNPFLTCGGVRCKYPDYVRSGWLEDGGDVLDFLQQFHSAFAPVEWECVCAGLWCSVPLPAPHPPINGALWLFHWHWVLKEAYVKVRNAEGGMLLLSECAHPCPVMQLCCCLIVVSVCHLHVWTRRGDEGGGRGPLSAPV